MTINTEIRQIKRAILDIKAKDRREQQTKGRTEVHEKYQMQLNILENKLQNKESLKKWILK